MNMDPKPAERESGEWKLAHQTAEYLPFEPIDSQLYLLYALDRFITAGGSRSVFIINGYAGTGKTSLVGAFVKALEASGMPVVILAPTGRAAKVASSFASHPASTIHKRLYRGDSSNPANHEFFLAPNELSRGIFVVDEASLITDVSGQGRSLLSHLVHHVYSSPGCRMILVGDVAQLPPVGQEKSTAMDKSRLAELGLDPMLFTLDVPVRQNAGSGIIHNATFIRQLLFGSIRNVTPRIFVSAFPDVEVIRSQDLAERLSTSWAEVGQEETLIVTRSNKRANNFNRAIRNLVMYAEEPLERGDRIIVSKNDYFWSRRNQLKTFIANGDTAEVTWIGKTEKMYGRYFCDVELRLYSEEAIVGAKIMLRSLNSDGSAIPRDEMQRLFIHVQDSYEGSLSQKIKGVMEDPYYNAIQAKYAYCVTCHKAQGGQWRHVYIDMGGIAPENMDSDFLRWLYTAMTRSTEKLFFINPTVKVE